MRITFDDLVAITSEKTPKAQAEWFNTHLNVDAIYDSNGVIITSAVFNALVAKKYGVLTAKNDQFVEPESEPELMPLQVKQNENTELDYDEIIRIVQNTQARPPHYNRKKAAELLGISGPTLTKYIKEGRIKLNLVDMVPAVEIDKFLHNKRNQSNKS